MTVNNLKDLFVHELRDIYSAEKQILEALPKMEDQASSRVLKEAFGMHRDQTEKQVDRLDRIFKQVGSSPSGVTCTGVQGIIAEGEQLASQAQSPDVLDAGLISAAQRVEHYEMAAYGTARTYARTLGETDFASLLDATLAEEKQSDQKLTELAERGINVQAKDAP